MHKYEYYINLNLKETLESSIALSLDMYPPIMLLLYLCVIKLCFKIFITLSTYFDFNI